MRPSRERARRVSTEALAKLTIFVTPAKAGVHNTLKKPDSGFHRIDAEALLQEAQLITE
jgi:hypothetical protein